MEKITITKEEYWEKAMELASEIKCNDRVISGFILSICALFYGMLCDKLFDEKEDNKKWN